MPVIVGIDTATPATAVGILSGSQCLSLGEPPLNGKPQHSTQVLRLIDQGFASLGIDWNAVTTIAVGVGPGGFTGLRIGLATARALGQALAVEVKPVSSLAALAVRARAASPNTTAITVLDARRDEVFIAGWRADNQFLEPRLFEPTALRGITAGHEATIFVGDGAIRYRELITSASNAVPADDSELHRIDAAALCELAQELDAVDVEDVLPLYCREPDARPPGSA